MGEFDLIKRYFVQENADSVQGVRLAVGDDCAVTTVATEQQLAITTDTLVCGTHFLPDISPADLAYKAVAVNLSDLAAMGAKPAWVSLALTLERLDPPWLAQFSQSLLATLADYQVALIGGDTTKGHLSLTLTAQGFLPAGGGLYRHQAEAGDWIFVSGSLGDSAAGLQLLLDSPACALNAEQQTLVTRHLRPTPRVALGQLLLAYSRCAIDISDGLLADLGHILARSGVGAELELASLPLSTALLHCYSREQAELLALSGGEDYELCFTVAPDRRTALENALQQAGIHCTCIGRITQDPTLRLFKQGKAIPLPQQSGFDHFYER